MSIGSQTLSFVVPSKGAAALVEHEASAELDNVDDDTTWRGRRTQGPLPHSHAIHANNALNRVISTTCGRQKESLQVHARVSRSPEWCKDDERRQNTTRVSHYAVAKRGGGTFVPRFAVRAVPGAAADGGGLVVDA